MKIRLPAVSGQFYKSNAVELEKQIKECFLSKFGPGSLPGKERKKQAIGAIAPHAGYQFSGPGAAWVYKEIAESAMPDTYVLLGLSHMGLPSCISQMDWKTPLGIAKNDSEFGKALAGNFGIPANEDAHSKEHSIEVQLPFLQFVCPKARIAPIIVSHDVDYREISAAIRKTAAELKRKIVVIASSDFTHYGTVYGYAPFSGDIKKKMYSLDKGAIDAIKTLDSSKFISYVNEKQATICGQMPIAVLLEAIDAKKAKLLSYYTSGDIVGDYANAVGYASIVFE